MTMSKWTRGLLAAAVLGLANAFGVVPEGTGLVAETQTEATIICQLFGRFPDYCSMCGTAQTECLGHNHVPHDHSVSAFLSAPNLSPSMGSRACFF